MMISSDQLDFLFQSAKKLLDVILTKAHELGYDETKPRLPVVMMKEESLEASTPASPNVRASFVSKIVLTFFQSQRGRPAKKSLKTPEQNIQMLYSYIREYRVSRFECHGRVIESSFRKMMSD